MECSLELEEFLGLYSLIFIPASSSEGRRNSCPFSGYVRSIKALVHDENFLSARLILLQWEQNEQWLPLDAGDFHLSLPFFVCLQDTNFPKCVISCPSGESCFSLPPNSGYLQDAWFPAPFFLLTPNYLPGGWWVRMSVAWDPRSPAQGDEVLHGASECLVMGMFVIISSSLVPSCSTHVPPGGLSWTMRNREESFRGCWGRSKDFLKSRQSNLLVFFPLNPQMDLLGCLDFIQI